MTGPHEKKTEQNLGQAIVYMYTDVPNPYCVVRLRWSVAHQHGLEPPVLLWLAILRTSVPLSVGFEECNASPRRTGGSNPSRWATDHLNLAAQ